MERERSFKWEEGDIERKGTNGFNWALEIIDTAENTIQ